ncbi:MAG: hypothetical protein KGJ64_00545 [Betaproteobacteria bacterium]|nr:hypothetical protein [Betaproteobacteria bacterium]
MRRLFLSVFTVLVVATAGLAHAGTVSYELINRTDLSFDYSLQLAHVLYFTSPTNPSYLGKSTFSQLTDTPSIGGQQVSSFQSYIPATAPRQDGVAFAMRTPDGKTYGMWPTLEGHTCEIPRDADGVNVQFVLLNRGRSGAQKLHLIEYTPDGGTCDFSVVPGGGTPLWNTFLPHSESPATSSADSPVTHSPW